MDVIEGMPQGKALDIMQSSPVINFNCHLTGTNNIKETAHSDVVVITSGIGRKPGMSRDELLATNMNIVRDVTLQVADASPDGIIIVVTNPVDAMAHLALRASGFPRERVFGLSGVLDGARLRTFIAAELKVSPEDVYACVLGQHGENMVVIPRLTTVGGRPITEIFSPQDIERLISRTVNGGAEIVGLLKTGSAYYAPSAAAALMAESILLDKKRVLNCAAYLDGEYGLKGTVTGVPVKLGKDGVEQIVELKLTPEEKAKLNASAEAVRQAISQL